jgi:hypothetical protein
VSNRSLRMVAMDLSVCVVTQTERRATCLLLLPASESNRLESTQLRYMERLTEVYESLESFTSLDLSIIWCWMNKSDKNGVCFINLYFYHQRTTESPWRKLLQVRRTNVRILRQVMILGSFIYIYHKIHQASRCSCSHYCFNHPCFVVFPRLSRIPPQRAPIPTTLHINFHKAKKNLDVLFFPGLTDSSTLMAPNS